MSDTFVVISNDRLKKIQSSEHQNKLSDSQIAEKLYKNPEIEQSIKLYSNIQSILQKPNINDEEKVKFLKTLTYNFNEIYNKKKIVSTDNSENIEGLINPLLTPKTNAQTPVVKTPSTPPTKALATTSPESSRQLLDPIFTKVQKSSIREAKLILALLKTKNVLVDADYKVKVKSLPFKPSKPIMINDFLHAVTKKKGVALSSQDILNYKRLIQHLDIPIELIKNTSVLQSLKWSTSSDSDTVATPDIKAKYTARRKQSGFGYVTKKQKNIKSKKFKWLTN